METVGGELSERSLLAIQSTALEKEVLDSILEACFRVAELLTMNR